MSSSLKRTVNSLLTKLISHRNLDVFLILSALLDLPIPVSLSLIKNNVAAFGAQFLRIMSLANIALVICSNHKQNEFLKACQKIKHESVWGYILGNYGVIICHVRFTPSSVS